MSTTIIIGTSAAGIAAANKLRDLRPDEQIICLTKEYDLPYNRCLLADYLGGSKTEEAITTRSRGYFHEKNIEFKTGFMVTGIDIVAREVMSALPEDPQGERLTFDNLIIASGRSSTIPLKFGMGLDGVLPFYDLAHARAITAWREQHAPRTAVVVGAGLTGLECADALAGHGIAVTLVEQAPQLLPRQLDHAGSEFLIQRMASKGVTALTNETIIDLVAAHGKIAGVVLASGRELPAQLVVFATGGRQNIAMLAGGGILTDDHGVVVNDRQETNIPGIYAAGDVCSVHDLLTGGRTSSCLWPDAVQQGMVAAHAIAGAEKRYAGALSITSSHIFGTTFVTCGNNFNRTDSDVRVKKEADFYHRFYLENNIITGFVMVGNVSNLGQLRSAMLNKQPIG